jgi:hypothetical protein
VQSDSRRVGPISIGFIHSLGSVKLRITLI